MARFLSEEGAPEWRPRAEEVLRALDAQNGPEALNGIRPLRLADGSLGIGTNFRRRPVFLWAGLFFLVLGIGFLWLLVYASHQIPPLSAIDLAVSMFLAGGFLAMSAAGLYLFFLKSPTADSIVVADPLGAYVAWRPRQFRNRPRQVTLHWSQDQLDLSVRIAPRAIPPVYEILLWRISRAGGGRRKICAIQVDPQAVDLWESFRADVRVAFPAAT